MSSAKPETPPVEPGHPGVTPGGTALVDTGLKLTSRATYAKEGAFRLLFLLCATVAVAGVALIVIFVGLRGWPAFAEHGRSFLLSQVWEPTAGDFGVMPLLLGSIAVTAGALLLGAPLAVGTAVFLSEIASSRMRRIVRPAVELLAGIPSVIYGFFGLVVLVPLVGRFTDGMGFGPATAAIILAIMVVPTIATLTEDALGSVHPGIREASYGMGATTWQTIWRILLPAAKVGIIDAVILGMGRAIGETMAVLMVVGNAGLPPTGLAEPMSTMTSQIVMGMSYASGAHRTALFGLAVILFAFSMGLVAMVRLVSRLGGASR